MGILLQKTFMTHNAYDINGGRKYLNNKENSRFLRETQNLSPERQAFCLTLYYSGCRISEVLNLRPIHIEAETGIISILCLKKRERQVWRRLPLPALLIQILIKIQRNDELPLWNMSRTTAWRVIKQTMENATITGTQASPKGLRHAFGVRAVMNGIPLTVIRNWMGHEKLSTTSIYLDVTGEEDKALIRKTW